MSTSHRRGSSLSACVLVALTLSACQRDGDDVPQGAAGEGDRAASLTDGQILGIVNAINEGEVQQARAVMPRLNNPAAQRFAEQMVQEHGAANDRFQAIASELGITAENSDVREELLRESRTTVERLQGGTPTMVNQDYLDSQVKMHRRALEVIDRRLQPAVEEERFRQELDILRGHVARHLAEVEQLQAK